jgi:hypothetical protein
MELDWRGFAVAPKLGSDDVSVPLRDIICCGKTGTSSLRHLLRRTVTTIKSKS